MTKFWETYINFRHLCVKVISYIFKAKEKKTYKYDLSFVCIFKNEIPYLKEWIEYHKLVAGENANVHFYMFDNKSTDNPKQVLLPYIKNKEVTYSYVNAENYPQNQIYSYASLKYRNKTKYMAFIDIDEFLVPVQDTPLLQVLENIFSTSSDIGGIGINWLCFGSSGHLKKPDTPVIESYTMRSNYDYEANKHIKTIANPRKIKWFFCCHFPKYHKNFHNVNDSLEPIFDFYNDHREYKLLRLHHYASKSFEEAQARENKGFGKRSYLDINKIKHNRHDINDVKDTIMLDRYVNELKKHL